MKLLELLTALVMLFTPLGAEQRAYDAIDFEECAYVDTEAGAHAGIDAALAEAQECFGLRFDGQEMLEAACDALYESSSYVLDYDVYQSRSAEDDIDAMFTVDYTVGYEIIKALSAGSESELNERQSTTLTRAREVLDGLALDGMDEVGRELAIHDWLAENVTYTDGEDCEDAYGALVLGTAHCNGYTDAFYLLGTLAGLDVGYMAGMAAYDDDMGAHAWNTVRLGEKSYFVDVTWDDDDVYAPSHEYFNMPSSALKQTHEYDEADAPAGLAEVYDENSYFAFSDRIADDGKALYWMLKAALEGHENYVQAASWSDLDLNDCLYKLMDDVEAYYGNADDMAWYEQELGGLNVYYVWFNEEYYE